MRIIPFALILAMSLASAACGPRNKDKLADNELGQAEGTKSDQSDARCATRFVSDEVKRQLFARAAEIRGSNGDNYARIAGFTLIEISGAAPVSPVSAAELADCRGHATIRLPAGLKVAGGRTSLGGDVSYSVGPGPRGAVSLGQSDAISIPLATLTQNRSASPRAPAEPAPDSAPRPPSVPASPPPPIASAPPPAPRPPIAPEAPTRPTVSAGAARPSFNCRNARTSGERAVCDSPMLAGLDRSMAAQYRSALANGDPAVRRLLVQTRDRFLSYRDRCGSDACIANTYRGRMREIEDIAEGRWRGGR